MEVRHTGEETCLASGEVLLSLATSGDVHRPDPYFGFVVVQTETTTRHNSGLVTGSPVAVPIKESVACDKLEGH